METEPSFLRNREDTANDGMLSKIYESLFGDWEYKPDAAQPRPSAQQIQQIEECYRVSLSRDGQARTIYGEREYLRTPTISELNALRDALEKSEPDTHHVENDAPLQIDFLSTPSIYGNAVLASYTDDGDKRPDGKGIVIAPNARPTYDLMHAILMHEFSHHAVSNAQKRGLLPNQLLGSLGWKQLNREGDIWALEAKDGQLYFRLDGRWARIDQQGETLDADGQVTTDERKRSTISNDEMMELAKVRQVSKYFDRAGEAVAETLTLLRTSAADRAFLLQHNRAVYDAAKTFDQQEIDNVFGTNDDGTHRFIRMQDGHLTPYSAENQSAVDQWEQDAAATPAAKISGDYCASNPVELKLCKKSATS